MDTRGEPIKRHCGTSRGTGRELSLAMEGGGRGQEKIQGNADSGVYAGLQQPKNF